MFNYIPIDILCKEHIILLGNRREIYLIWFNKKLFFHVFVFEHFVQIVLMFLDFVTDNEGFPVFERLEDMLSVIHVESVLDTEFVHFYD